MPESKLQLSAMELPQPVEPEAARAQLVVVARVDPEAADPESEVPKTQLARRIRYRADGEGWRGEAFAINITLSTASTVRTDRTTTRHGR